MDAIIMAGKDHHSAPSQRFATSGIRSLWPGMSWRARAIACDRPGVESIFARSIDMEMVPTSDLITEGRSIGGPP